MNENILKNAEFGQRFVTRDGKTALYISPEDGYFLESVGSHLLYVQYHGFENYFDNGLRVESYNSQIDSQTDIEYEDVPESSLDIIHKCEPRESKIMELARNSSPYKYENREDRMDDWIFREGFKKGCYEGINKIGQLTF